MSKPTLVTVICPCCDKEIELSLICPKTARTTWHRGHALRERYALEAQVRKQPKKTILMKVLEAASIVPYQDANQLCRRVYELGPTQTPPKSPLHQALHYGLLETVKPDDDEPTFILTAEGKSVLRSMRQGEKYFLTARTTTVEESHPTIDDRYKKQRNNFPSHMKKCTFLKKGDPIQVKLLKLAFTAKIESKVLSIIEADERLHAETQYKEFSKPRFLTIIRPMLRAKWIVFQSAKNPPLIFITDHGIAALDNIVQGEKITVLLQASSSR